MPPSLLRSLAALLGVLGLAAALLGGCAGRAAEPAPPRSFTSSRQCRACHEEVYAEWEASQHAAAWTNPEVRFLSNDFANQDCVDCHAPRPVFTTGVGRRVLPREARRVEGVDCIACHQLPASEGGGMAATADAPSAPCRPTATPDLTRAEHCGGCHNQHKTVDQWRGSAWPERGEDCLSCHMPFRDGDPSKGRDHRFLGSHHQATLNAAVELRGRFEGGRYHVELENVGAGHAFPTDERSRAADLFWRLSGSTGRESWRHLYRIRDPYRHETHLPSTLLHADATLTLEVESVPEGASIEVVLFYKRSPYWEDPALPDPEREAIRMHAVTISP
ncbi:MAG: multiheme c-type cytochrome [Planctomycetota bacterium]